MESNSDLTNWTLLAASGTLDAYIDTVVDDIPTMLIRTGEGICFCITAPEESLPQFTSKTTKARLLMEGKLAGKVVIGRLIYDRKDLPNGYWPIVIGDEKLSSHLEKVMDHFHAMIERFGAWESFTAFLAHDIQYDVSSMGPLQQLPLAYWWLCGEGEEGKPIHVPFSNQETGTFIRPGDGVLPVYSSSLFADMAAQIYSRRYEVTLTPCEIPCLGCYLHGFSNDFPEKIVKAIVLNEQWVIEHHICKEHSGGHFFLQDGEQHRFVLIGCNDKGHPPVWCEKKWDPENRWFTMECVRT